MNFKDYCENLLNEGWIETSKTEYLKKYLQDVKGIRQKTKLAIEAELRKRGNQDQKLNQESFIQKVLHDGFIPLDNGKNRFVVTQINDKNFTDIDPKLKQQLIEEGKWNSWIGFIWWRASDRYSVQALPIYGSSNRYITDWFTNTAEEAIKQSLRDKDLQLLQRANKTYMSDVIKKIKESKYEAKNSVAYSQGYDSARQIEKFKSKDDAGKAATFFVRKYGYSQKPGEAADFIQGFMDYYNSQHESLNETLESLNNKNNIQKDLNAAMIKLSHLKKEMYKASPGLRDTYQGEIDNLKSYINNLKQKLKEKSLSK